MTTAEKVSAKFNNNGFIWDVDGKNIGTVAEEMGGSLTEAGNGIHKYVFTDGSGIVMMMKSWDIALSDADGCFCPAGSGVHQESCPVKK